MPPDIVASDLYHGSGENLKHSSSDSPIPLFLVVFVFPRGPCGFLTVDCTCIVPPFARPIPSVYSYVYSSVCLKHPEHCGNGEKYTYSYYGKPIQEAVPGLLRRPISDPIRPPLPQTWGWQPRVKTCIANCGQTVPDTKGGLY